MREEYGIEIYDPDSDRLVVSVPPGRPMTRAEAFYELERWRSFGYDTRRVMRREVIEEYGEWQEVSADEPLGG